MYFVATVSKPIFRNYHFAISLEKLKIEKRNSEALVLLWRAQCTCVCVLDMCFMLGGVLHVHAWKLCCSALSIEVARHILSGARGYAYQRHSGPGASQYSQPPTEPCAASCASCASHVRGSHVK